MSLQKVLGIRLRVCLRQVAPEEQRLALVAKTLDIQDVVDVDCLLEHYSKCFKALPGHPNLWMECFQAKAN